MRKSSKISCEILRFEVFKYFCDFASREYNLWKPKIIYNIPNVKFEIYVYKSIIIILKTIWLSLHLITIPFVLVLLLSIYIYIYILFS